MCIMRLQHALFILLRILAVSFISVKIIYLKIVGYIFKMRFRYSVLFSGRNQGQNFKKTDCEIIISIVKWSNKNKSVICLKDDLSSKTRTHLSYLNDTIKRQHPQNEIIRQRPMNQICIYADEAMIHKHSHLFTLSPSLRVKEI